MPHVHINYLAVVVATVVTRVVTVVVTLVVVRVVVRVVAIVIAIAGTVVVAAIVGGLRRRLGDATQQQSDSGEGEEGLVHVLPRDQRIISLGSSWTYAINAS